MKSIILVPNEHKQIATPTKEIFVDDFGFAARGVVNSADPEALYVLSAPKSFSWCSLAITAMSSSAELFCTLSDPKSISAGTAVWFPWSIGGVEDNAVVVGNTRLFSWEWPLVALAIKSAGSFRYEHAHKII